MTRDELYAMPEIRTYFPLLFEPGRARWNEFTVTCSDCKTEVPQHDTRGYVVPQSTVSSYREHSKITSYHVVAQALCPTCNRVTTADYTLGVNQDGSLCVTGRHPKTGEESVWGTHRTPWWTRVVERMLDMFS